ncbi:MAG: UvrD-helicase domain-containing protein [Flexilinea sp.]
MSELSSNILSKLSRPQRTAAAERSRNVIVTAGAGSGKTHTLVARYLTLLEEGLMPDEIAAITFTEKASREMKFRVRRELDEITKTNINPATREDWLDRINAMDSAYIGTIHGLCSRILRVQFAEAGIDPCFQVLDENRGSIIKVELVDDWLEKMAEQEVYHRLFSELKVNDIKRILFGMLAKRQEAQEILANPIDIVHSINKSVEEIFENRKVREAVILIASMNLPEIIADAGENLAGQLKDFLQLWGKAESAYTHGNSLECLRILQTAYSEKMKLNSGKSGSETKQALKSIREVLDKDWKDLLNKNCQIPSDADEKSNQELTGSMQFAFQGLLASYRKTLSQQAALDFDDLEEKTLIILQNPEVRKKLQKQFKAVLVDEFQDTNDRQRRLVETLAGSPGCFFAVGDARQSIYRFRGADVSVFRAVRNSIKMQGGLLVDLDETYRTHSELLAVSGDFLQRIMGKEDNPQKDYEIPFSPLIPVKMTSGQQKAPHLEFLLGFDPDFSGRGRKAAAGLLTARLNEWKGTGIIRSWDDAVLLFRASGGFTNYEEALENAGIPFVTVSGKGFYDRPEIRDVLNMLKAITNPLDDLAMAGLLLSPAFGLSKDALYQLRWSGSPGSISQTREPSHLFESLQGDLPGLAIRDRQTAVRSRRILNELIPLPGRVSVEDLLTRLIFLTGYRTLLAAEPNGRLWRNLDKLVSDAQKSGIIAVNDFLEYIQNLNDAGAREGEAPPDDVGVVRLMTIHKAKGLEFPVVILADAGYNRVNWGEPFILSQRYGLNIKTDPESLGYKFAVKDEKDYEDAEAKRLLYVAMTRARDKLIISGHFNKKGINGWLGELLEPWKGKLTEMTEKAGYEVLWKTENGFPFSVKVRVFEDSEMEVTKRIEFEPAETENELIPLSSPLISGSSFEMETDSADDILPFPVNKE